MAARFRLGLRCVDQVAAVRQPIEPPAPLDDAFCGSRSHHASGKVAQLVLQVAVTHRPFQVAEGMLHMPSQLRTVFKGDAHDGLIGPHRLDFVRPRQVVDARQGGVFKDRICELVKLGATAHQPDGCRMVDRKLAIEPNLEVFFMQSSKTMGATSTSTAMIAAGSGRCSR